MRLLTQAAIEKPPFAERGAYRIELPAGLADDAGRPLANAARFPLLVNTGDFPPLAKFAAPFGIIEAAEGGVLPVTLRGVESPVAAKALGGRDLSITNDALVAKWLQRLTEAEERSFIEQPIAGSDETRRIATRRPPAVSRALCLPPRHRAGLC